MAVDAIDLEDSEVDRDDLRAHQMDMALNDSAVEAGVERGNIGAILASEGLSRFGMADDNDQIDDIDDDGARLDERIRTRNLSLLGDDLEVADDEDPDFRRAERDLGRASLDSFYLAELDVDTEEVSHRLMQIARFEEGITEEALTAVAHDQAIMDAMIAGEIDRGAIIALLKEHSVKNKNGHGVQRIEVVGGEDREITTGRGGKRTNLQGPVTRAHPSRPSIETSPPTPGPAQRKKRRSGPSQPEAN